jgi:PAS domain S-box-containing protein
MRDPARSAKGPAHLPSGRLPLQQDQLFTALAEASGDSIFGISPEGVILAWNPAAERMYGYTAQEAVGQSIALIIPSENRVYALERIASFRASERLEAIHVTREGKRIEVDVTLSTVLDSEGKPIAQCAIVRDVTDAKRAAKEFERLASAVAAAHDSIIVWDVHGTILSWNPASKHLYGFTPEEAIGQSIRILLQPTQWERWRAVTAEILEGKRFDEHETVRLHKSGQLIHVALTASGICDERGKPSSIVTISRDISERKRAEKRHNLLLEELNHRVKNMLATVQSIAIHSFRDGLDVEVSRRNFAGRLVALAKAHELLSRASWSGVKLRDLLEQVLGPYGVNDTSRVVIEVPDVQIPSRISIVLALALQELATNAAKYGALSRADGQVYLNARVAHGPHDDWLQLCWREQRGPAVTAPTRHGFGSRMIEMGVAQELDGKVSILYDRDGVVCTMEIPLPMDSDTIEKASG